MAIIYACLASLIVAVFSFSATDSKVVAVREAPRPRTAKQLYRQQCAACHGLDGRAQTTKGKFSHARDLADAKWQDDVTNERIFNSIMNGRNVRGNMPSFSDKFSEAQVNLLVTFVRGLRKGEK